MILDGKKTYILAGVTILYAIFAFLTGNIDGNNAVELIMGALGGAALRNGLK